MNIMNKREMEAFRNRLAHIAGDVTALCALTETAKDAASKEDDPYAGAMCGIHMFLCDIMESLNDAADSIEGASGV